METELLDNSSGNVARKGSQKLGHGIREMWRSRKNKLLKMEEEKILEHVYQLMGMIHWRWMSLREAS